MRKNSIILISALTLFSCAKQADHMDSSQSPEKRVDLLLAKMTVEEKAAQLCYIINAEKLILNEQGEIDEAKVLDSFKDGIGSVSFAQVKMPMDRAIALNNALQKIMVEKTRLGIPLVFVGEGQHGFMGVGATVFPQAIALGCTWDTLLIEQVYSVAARELRVRGFQQVLSPVIDLGREPRWGRIEETYSEDPYLTARIGKAAVLGFQGREKVLGEDRVIATLKHFVGHGESVGGNNTSPIVCDERYLRENHMYPFEIAVKEANALSVMPSYNEWAAIPNHANPWLLNTVLRDEWGFDGNVISDQGGVEDLYRKHFVAETPEQATKMALLAGVDSEIMDRESYYFSLAKLVRSGVVSEKDLDRAVRRVLLNKFRVGIFEAPYADLEAAKTITNSAEHKALALQAAHKSAVLLKNNKDLLPLNPRKIKRMAVIGPNAANVHFGGYSIEPRVGISVLEGIKQFAQDQFEVVYAEGCKITTTPGSFWDNDNTEMNNELSDRKLIAEAKSLASRSDVVLLVIGENESICREAWSENHRGDRDGLNLFGRQEELIKALVQTGKPIVALLINGRPITANYLVDSVPAILEGWYLGQETGTAVADIIFGKVNPSGKLSVTIPKNIGQLPAYYNKKPSRDRSYVNSDMTPLFPFGYGLSYTRFSYGDPVLSRSEIEKGESLTASVVVTNEGVVAGDEIVQLYIRDKVSSVTRPVKELKDFARITLNPGENRTVVFTITPEKLQFFNHEMMRAVEPGEYEVMIGPNSAQVSVVPFRVK
ncbi:MAG: glycoside hydrolase family 3 N-terminal domain-containing protein [Tenuifilaceae bacterium]|jgi:beta-glucosidase|nr:glycoside hydrolase family 3 N-terminal domain-containing protein [Tenuifilaceae bacterium]